MQKQYAPERKRAILPSAGVLPGYLFLTEHTYVRTETRPDRLFGNLRPGHHHVYRCAVTGAERDWGVEGLATPEELAPTALQDSDDEDKS